MRLPAARHIDTQESAAGARARMAMMLPVCTDEALARMTAAGLASTHRVSVTAAEAALAHERQRRSARG